MVNTASAQRSAGSFIKIEILKGSSNSTCSDVNGDLDNLWGVNIAGTGYKYYVPTGSCELSAPNIQYERFLPFDNHLSDSIEVCFRAMDFKGSSYCDPIGDCVETICKKFPVPTRGPVDKELHTLCLPKGGDSEGCIEFLLEGFESRRHIEDRCRNGLCYSRLSNFESVFLRSRVENVLSITSANDAVNDKLIFDSLTSIPGKYPNNKIFIFNRRGDIVYQAAPYANNWSGQNDRGQDLPEGIYYYVLELDVANGVILNGSITILR